MLSFPDPNADIAQAAYRKGCEVLRWRLVRGEQTIHMRPQDCACVLVRDMRRPARSHSHQH